MHARLSRTDWRAHTLARIPRISRTRSTECSGDIRAVPARSRARSPAHAGGIPDSTSGPAAAPFQTARASTSYAEGNERRRSRARAREWSTPSRLSARFSPMRAFAAVIVGVVGVAWGGSVCVTRFGPRELRRATERQSRPNRRRTPRGQGTRLLEEFAGLRVYAGPVPGCTRVSNAYIQGESEPRRASFPSTARRVSQLA